LAGRPRRVQETAPAHKTVLLRRRIHNDAADGRLDSHQAETSEPRPISASGAGDNIELFFFFVVIIFLTDRVGNV
jgi:hypothetical protein